MSKCRWHGREVLLETTASVCESTSVGHDSGGLKRSRTSIEGKLFECMAVTVIVL